LVGYAALGERLGRNQRFASTGGVVAAGLMGLVAHFNVANRGLDRICSILTSFCDAVSVSFNMRISAENG
jgi:hypothetical protein